MGPGVGVRVGVLVGGVPVAVGVGVLVGGVPVGVGVRLLVGVGVLVAAGAQGALVAPVAVATGNVYGPMVPLATAT
jgi:hypothetical protein